MVFISCVLYFSALNHPHQNHDDGDDQKDVDEVAHRVARNQSQQPQDDQDESERVEHGFIWFQVDGKKTKSGSFYALACLPSEHGEFGS
jgi:hypothetical protein